MANAERYVMNAQAKIASNDLNSVVAQFAGQLGNDDVNILAQAIANFEVQMNKFEIMTTNNRGHIQTGDAILFGVIRIAKELADEVSAPLNCLLTTWVNARWRNQDVHLNHAHLLFKVYGASKIDSEEELSQLAIAVNKFFIFSQKDLIGQLSVDALDLIDTIAIQSLQELGLFPKSFDSVWVSPFKHSIYMNLANVIIGMGTDSLIVKRYFDEFHGAIETLNDLYDYHEFYKEFHFRNTLNQSEKARLMVNFLNHPAKTKLLMSMNHNRIGFMPLFRNFRNSELWNDNQWIIEPNATIINYSSQVFLNRESFNHALQNPKAYVDFFADPDHLKLEDLHHVNVILLEMLHRHPKYLKLIKSLKSLYLRESTFEMLTKYSFHSEEDLNSVEAILNDLLQYDDAVMLLKNINKHI